MDFNASDKMVKKISSNGAAFFNFLFRRLPILINDQMSGLDFHEEVAARPENFQARGNIPLGKKLPTIWGWRF